MCPIDLHQSFEEGEHGNLFQEHSCCWGAFNIFQPCTMWCRFAQIVQVGNDHGIRFPRELGMLLKQLLYFDRYTRILAPQMSVLADDRIRLS